MSDRNVEFQGSIPEVYDEYLGPIIFEGYAADLAGRVSVGEGGRVLELASGTGISARRLRDALPSSASLVATDLNEPMLEVAQKKFAPGENVEFQPADATTLPFGDNEFDAVTCQFGVMFFPDKAEAFSEVARVLKPGGTFVFNVWDAMEHNPLAANAAKRILKFFPDGVDNFYDVPFGFHDQSVIAPLLEAAGFTDLSFETCPREAIGKTAKDAAFGFVKGNPMILHIRDNPDLDEDQIVDAVAATLREIGGDNPVRTTMQAVVITARGPG